MFTTRLERYATLGGGIVGTHAGDMISEIARSIEMGADAVDFTTPQWR